MGYVNPKGKIILCALVFFLGDSTKEKKPCGGRSRLHGGTGALLLPPKVTKSAGGFPATPPGPPRRLLRSASNPSPRVRCKSMVRIQQALKNTGAPAALLLQSLARRMQAREYWCRGVLRKYSSGGFPPGPPAPVGYPPPRPPAHITQWIQSTVMRNSLRNVYDWMMQVRIIQFRFVVIL